MELNTLPNGTLEGVGRDNGAQQAGRLFGLYLQDSVAIGQRWNLTAGLRYDRSSVWLPEQTRPDSFWAGLIADEQNGAAFRSATFAETDINDWGDLVPRATATYDTSGRGSTLLKGSYAQYSMQQTTNLAGLFNPNRGGLNEYLWSDANGDGIFQYGEQGDLIGSFFPGLNTELDPDLRSARTYELTLGVEHQAWGDLVVGATLIYRNVNNVVETIDIGVPYGPVAAALAVEDPYTPVEITDPGPDGVLGTHDDGGPITVWNQDPSTFGQNQVLLTNPERWGFDVPFDYRALELVVRKRFSDRWQLLGSWTLGRHDSSLGGGNAGAGFTARGTFRNPNSDINRFGRTANDRTHIVKLNGSYMFADPIGVNLAVSLRYESGIPVNRRFITQRGVLNQGRVRVVAAPLGEDDNPASLGGRLDAITILDLRAEKQLALPGRWGRLTLSVGAFNLLNESATRSTITNAAGAYGRIRAIVAPRMVRLGLGWMF